MATFNIRAGRERTVASRGTLGDSFRHAMQGLSHIQEAVLQQERVTEERLREMEQMIREAAAEQERRLQQERQATEAALASLEEERRVVTSALEDKLRRVEARMERRPSHTSGQKRHRPSDVIDRLADLDSRMVHLEASTERALQCVVPRVDALLNQLKKPSPPHPTSSSASTSTSASISAFSSAPRPRSSSARSSATSPLMPERRKELGEQLIKASKEGKSTDVRRLLDEGADVNYCDNHQQTPLLCASNSPDINIVSLFIEMGADVNASTTARYTALHYAALNDSSGRCVSLLIRAGALVDSANVNGQTPLYLAVVISNEAAARALLAAGASKKVRDNDGKTLRQRASTDNIRRLLRR